MTIVDFIVIVPAVLVAAWLCVWTVLHGDEPMRNGKKLFIKAVFIALGLAGWSVVCDVIANSEVETYFVHAGVNCFIVFAGLMCGFIVSSARPQSQRG